MALATVLFGVTAPLPRGPADLPPLGSAAPPASLQEAGDSARAAWQRRDLAEFVSAAGGGRLLVSLPAGPQSAPVTPDQARAILSSYVQGTKEVKTTSESVSHVDSTRGYVQLLRRYRLLGVPGERESVILLGYRRGREIWVLTEVRIVP
jgi:hypothetical protein